MPQNKIDLIKKYNLTTLSVFAGFSESQIESELSGLCMTVKEYCKNQTIVREYDKVSIGIVISGQARVEKTDWNGNRNILFEISSDTVFGESLFCTDAEYFRLSIIAEKQTSVLFIDPGSLENSNKKLIINLMKIMAGNTLIFREKLDILSRRTTQDRLLQYLSIQARKNGSNSFNIPLDRQALADYLCVERTALSKVIAKLQKMGIFSSRKNYFELNLKGTFKTPF